jgi:hypothetical protein
MSCRTSSRILVGVSFTLAVLQAFAAESLYHFVDEHGVPHYSNQPLDPRYRPLGVGGEAGRPQPALSADAEVDISVPDQASLGELFEVTLSMAKPPAAAGFLELSFDPEAIALQAISVDASITEPGKVRIELKLDPAKPGQTLANLSFQAVAPTPTQAALHVTQLELFTPKGEMLPVHAGSSANVRLVQ